MGNYFSINKHPKASNLQDNPTYFKTEVIDPSLLCGNPQNSTPVRPNNIRAFDPRSPTDDIDRTPIMFNEECLQVPDSPMFPAQHADVMVDPRSPSAGITRTPVTLMDEVPAVQGNVDLDGLIQVLNFTDLDNLSLSDIESPSEDEMEVEQKQPEVVPIVSVPKEEVKTVSAPPSTNNTPNKSKSSQKGSDENNGSLNVSKSSPGGLLARPRVPFGDVNRPVLAASPRLQLQTKQKLNLRSEIIQQHHRI